MAELKFEIVDWKNGDAGTESVDARPWTVEVKTKSQYHKDKTIDGFDVIANCPDGTKRAIWIEVCDGELVVHCYGTDHDEPLNVIIGKDTMKADDCRNLEGE